MHLSNRMLHFQQLTTDNFLTEVTENNRNLVKNLNEIKLLFPYFVAISH